MNLVPEFWQLALAWLFVALFLLKKSRRANDLPQPPPPLPPILEPANNIEHHGGNAHWKVMQYQNGPQTINIGLRTRTKAKLRDPTLSTSEPLAKKAWRNGLTSFCPFKDFFHKGEPSSITWLVNGDDLEDWFLRVNSEFTCQREERSSQLLKIARQLRATCQMLGRLELVHGDISASNLLIREKIGLCMIDFDNLAPITYEDYIRSAKGTPDAMPNKGADAEIPPKYRDSFGFLLYYLALCVRAADLNSFSDPAWGGLPTVTELDKRTKDLNNNLPFLLASSLRALVTQLIEWDECPTEIHCRLSDLMSKESFVEMEQSIAELYSKL